MRLGIINCDELIEPLRQEYQSYPAMFAARFSARDAALECIEYSAIEGIYPEHVSDNDAYLITGSKSGVYDDHDWLKTLAEFIETVFAQAIPLIGICFGHQMIAHTLGGRAEKSHKGWGLGRKNYHIKRAEPWMRELQVEMLGLLYSHQDQVVSLPEDAEPFAGDDFCEFAGFTIGHKVLTFQGHPEFTADYLRRLMIIRRERYPAHQYDDALSSLDEPHDGDIVIQWIINFIRQGMKNGTKK